MVQQLENPISSNSALASKSASTSLQSLQKREQEALQAPAPNSALASKSAITPKKKCREQEPAKILGETLVVVLTLLALLVQKHKY